MLSDDPYLYPQIIEMALIWPLLCSVEVVGELAVRIPV